MKLVRSLSTYSRVLLTAGLVTAAGMAQAAEPVSPKLKQNLDIMRDILQKSLQSPVGRGVSDIDVSYVMGQGVLFETRIEGGFDGWMFSGQPMPGMDPALMARINAEAARVSQAALAGLEVDEGALESLTSEAEAAAESMLEQQERLGDQLRELRDQKRDVERELRDVEREKRDIEFTQKVGKLDESQQKQMNQLQQKQKELQSKAQEMQTKYTAAEADYRKKREEKQKLAEQQQAEMVTKVGTNMAQTLCDYGAGLRELNDSQFVALKLQTRGRNSSDVYWVFNKADINACVTGKTTAANLLKKATYYNY
ncbi:MAG TPA: hypothetical protein DCS87_02855 [Rheinheimera sp.]|nr:hypothetical protein [Rheinheimera sp.]